MKRIKKADLERLRDELDQAVESAQVAAHAPLQTLASDSESTGYDIMKEDRDNLRKALDILTKAACGAIGTLRFYTDWVKPPTIPNPQSPREDVKDATGGQDV